MQGKGAVEACGQGDAASSWRRDSTRACAFRQQGTPGGNVALRFAGKLPAHEAVPVCPGVDRLGSLPGLQVFISYGSQANGSLLQYYGFTGTGWR